MNGQTPHYLLMSQAYQREMSGRWRFVLRPVGGSAGIEVSDVEPDTHGERLELLTVVRALESLDQPSRVTLISCSRYIEQGIQYGVAEWKENDWRWECFGQMTPVRDADLWQRVDQVLQFHRVDCRRQRFDAEHGSLDGPHWNLAQMGKSWLDGIKGSSWVKYHARLDAWCSGGMRRVSHWFRLAGVLARRVRNGHDSIFASGKPTG